MISHPPRHSAISRINLVFSQTKAVARFLCLGGGEEGGSADPKMFSDPRSGKKKDFFGLLGVSGGMLPGKFLK